MSIRWKNGFVNCTIFEFLLDYLRGLNFENLLSTSDQDKKALCNFSHIEEQEKFHKQFQKC